VVAVVEVVAVIGGLGGATGLPVLGPPWLNAGRNVLADEPLALLMGTTIAKLTARTAKRTRRPALARRTVPRSSGRGFFALPVPGAWDILVPHSGSKRRLCSCHLHLPG
jgi:hypothetical protein